MCTGDYLEIVGATTVCGNKDLSSRICGAVFTTNAHSTATNTAVGLDASICSCSPPFTVGIVTDAAVDFGKVVTVGANRGNTYVLYYSVLSICSPIEVCTVSP